MGSAALSIIVDVEVAGSERSGLESRAWVMDRSRNCSSGFLDLSACSEMLSISLNSKLHNYY